MSNWIEWDGGEQPVGNYVMVEMKFRDGVIETGDAIEYFWSWDEYVPEYDIVAYRVVS